MHSWTHYAFVVPFIWALNRNSKHTTYAAAWTLVNAHEVAAISGKVSIYPWGLDIYIDILGCCLQAGRRLPNRVV
jgi:hypothetical protein